ncbi:MAG: hypothetical protein IKO34_11440 [Bacteroidales bacterium]|nr:hypothetical protein [Bacteroidales bacterium]
MRRNIVISCILAMSVMFLACSGNGSKLGFDPISNFNSVNDTVLLDMDLEDVVLNGIVLPSVRQTSDDGFKFSFDVPSMSGEKLYYKIYYQNETYKFPEGDSLSGENFYGSWEDVSVGFKEINGEEKVDDFFRIVGNPRDEKIYYGSDIMENTASYARILKVAEQIRQQPEWYASIVDKAEKNGFSVEKQLFLDAQWVLANDRHADGNVNHRWKRNPRVGCYSFMLVVCNEEGLAEIPNYIKDISLTDENGKFVNPFEWFKNKRSSNIIAETSKKVLKTRAVITPKDGIFVDELNIRTPEYTIDTSCSECGSNDSLYRKALFQQFFPAVSQQYTLRNIPEICDVVGNPDFTLEEYAKGDKKYPASQRMQDYPQITDKPCSTVKVAENGEYITIVNPGSEANDMKKESTGIKTRLGFTYGKYRGKIKFPSMLNENNIWNGLTYAFWLIYQDNHPWNNRRGCYNCGYIDKGDDSPNPVRETFNKYSEIDIEIVKASRFWPEEYYRDKSAPKDDAMHNNEIMYCCTNWDLACPQPKKFSAGINYIDYKGTTYEAMRWSDLYKALTIKSPMSNDVFSEEYYYYEIEWRPTEIIWRLGSSPDNMKVVGYMNDEVTSIPNNQMLCIVTQEYHYSEWWPPIVFDQGLIPFNKSDIEGRVYEIVIE